MPSTKDHSETIALLRGMVVETISQAALTWPKTLGVVYANHGNLPRAIEQWERIMEISPEKKYIKESITRARRLLKQLKE